MEKYVTVWNKFASNSLMDKFKQRIRFVLQEYGTTLYENRFSTGMVIEDELVDYLKRINVPSRVVTQANRIDINIETLGEFSVKYAKGDVILHNSRGENKDMDMVNSIILTPSDTFMIIPSILRTYNITLADFVVDRKDSFVLSKKIFPALKKEQYPFIAALDLHCSNCSHVSVRNLVKKELDKAVPWDNLTS